MHQRCDGRRPVIITTRPSGRATPCTRRWVPARGRLAADVDRPDAGARRRRRAGQREPLCGSSGVWTSSSCCSGISRTAARLRALRQQSVSGTRRAAVVERCERSCASRRLPRNGRDRAAPFCVLQPAPIAIFQTKEPPADQAFPAHETNLPRCGGGSNGTGWGVARFRHRACRRMLKGSRQSSRAYLRRRSLREASQ